MKRENQADTLSSLAVPRPVNSAELQEFLSHWMTVNLCTLLAKKGNMKICEMAQYTSCDILPRCYSIIISVKPITFEDTCFISPF